MDRCGEIVELLISEGIRERFKVIVGGKSASNEFAKKIGADGYAESGVAAVRLLDNLLSYKMKYKQGVKEQVSCPSYFLGEKYYEQEDQTDSYLRERGDRQIHHHV
jgi:hypothetical protein